ncbi:nucleotidyltransferase family protein [Streptomyces prasinopilosus]|uniref:nucleotidyltransferase family protein n=1 Tax=Streptomyces prasinopilosus TaxID=67344 RepID=UPI0006EB3453|nr:nucleotidyltransferase family protein [Streptomyces prasinopilosus]
MRSAYLNAPRATGQVAGLLLAAGGGRRLGGRPKALLTHRGRPLVEHAVRTLRAGGCERVHVVLGARADEVRARAELPDCVLVDNPDWERGMGSSLRAGLASLAGTEARAALVLLVDQPGIGPQAVARLLAAYAARGTGRPQDARTPWTARDPREGREARNSLISAAYAGVRGHPVLFGAAHWAGVAAAATGDQGARAYLRDHSDAVALVECGDVAEAYDIDTEEDLSRLG